MVKPQTISSKDNKRRQRDKERIELLSPKSGYMKLKGMSDVSFLQHCDVFKSSLKEIKIVTECAKLGTAMKKVRKCGVKVVLVTMDREGILAYLDDKFYHIPACKPKILQDPTGAGDVFIGVFLAEYIQGREPLWCCCVGSGAASFVIEDVGSQRFGEKKEVYERATKIYEKGIKPLAQDTVV